MLLLLRLRLCRKNRDNRGEFLMKKIAIFLVLVLMLAMPAYAQKQGNTEFTNGITVSSGDLSINDGLVVGGTGDSNFDDGTLYIDATNNRIGIGTLYPSRLMTLYDASAPIMQLASQYTGYDINDGMQLSLDTSRNAYVTNKENADLYFKVNNTVKLTLDNTGNLGIGNTNPTSTLDVAGDCIISSDVTLTGIPSGTTKPVGVGAGQIWYDTDDDVLRLGT